MDQNQAVTFGDIIRKGFVEQFSGALEPLNVLITLALALIMGIFIYFIYKKTFGGVVYSRSFNLSLIMITMVTTLIIMTITSNLTLSLGMVGALSIVRFRTAVKDAIDTVYMFWCVAVGICLGAGFFGVAAVGTAIIGLVMFLLTTFKSRGSESYLLVLHYHDSISPQIKGLIKQLPQQRLKNKTVTHEGVELTLEIRVRPEDTGFVEKFLKIDGVFDASLISYQGDLIS